MTSAFEVDPEFRLRLRALRQERGLSYRQLAKIAYYSSTYLWEIETGLKDPSPYIANALDSALGTNGELAAFVVDRSANNGQSFDGPTSDVLVAMARCRGELEKTAHSAWSTVANGSDESPPHAASVVGTAAQWAYVASWLYDVFVGNRPRVLRLGTSRYSRRLAQETGTSPFRLEMARQGRVPETECRSVTRRSAPYDVAARLGLAAGADKVVCRENLYFADGEPVQLGVTYVSVAVAAGTPVEKRRALGAGGLYARLSERGYVISRIREEIKARMPTQEEAVTLRVPLGVPILELLHTSYDETQRPFEVTRFVVRSDLCAIDYRVPVED